LRRPWTKFETCDWPRPVFRASSETDIDPR
jgi:hypothetical protein